MNSKNNLKVKLIELKKCLKNKVLDNNTNVLASYYFSLVMEIALDTSIKTPYTNAKKVYDKFLDTKRKIEADTGKYYMSKKNENIYKAINDTILTIELKREDVSPELQFVSILCSGISMEKMSSGLLKKYPNQQFYCKNLLIAYSIENLHKNENQEEKEYVMKK